MSDEIHLGIQRLTRQGIAAHLNEDYVSALRFFDRAIERATFYKCSSSWACAYKGETHFCIAQKMKNYSDEQLKQFERARYWFNKALGLKENPNEPAITINNEEVKEPWILAHRGELLRVHANSVITLHNHELRSELYEEAEGCFEQAIKLDPEYAWAYAHWGAMLCNKRIKDKYRKALQCLQKAIELSDYKYPWAYAYKAAVLMELERSDLAYYDLLIAVRQDPYVISQGIHPPLEFNRTLPLGRRYGEALWQYEDDLERQPKNQTDLCYTQYHKLVVYKNIPKEFYTDYSAVEEHINKTNALEHQVKQDIYSYELKDSDKLYIKGGILSLDITEYIERKRKKEVKYLQTEGGGRGGGGCGDGEALSPISQESITESFSALLKTMYPVEYTDNESNQSSQSREYSLFDQPLKNKDVNMLCTKAFKALKMLEQVLNSLTDEEKKAEYQKKARLDVAWYYLRPLQEFQGLVT